MADTFTLISSYTATGTVSSIDFTSIPATYTDLVLVLSLRSSRNDASVGIANMKIGFNSSTTGYSAKDLYTQGSTPSSSSGLTDSLVGFLCPSSIATASTFGSTLVYIPNYAGSSYKSFTMDNVSENNQSTAPLWGMDVQAGLWSNTAAITSINIGERSADSSSGIVQYSTAYLYGVKNA